MFISASVPETSTLWLPSRTGISQELVLHSQIYWSQSQRGRRVDGPVAYRSPFFRRPQWKHSEFLLKVRQCYLNQQFNFHCRSLRWTRKSVRSWVSTDSVLREISVHWYIKSKNKCSQLTRTSAGAQSFFWFQFLETKWLLSAHIEYS